MRWKRSCGWRLVGSKWCYLCVWPDIHWKDPYDGGRALALVSSVQNLWEHEQGYIKLTCLLVIDAIDADDLWPTMGIPSNTPLEKKGFPMISNDFQMIFETAHV